MTTANALDTARQTAGEAACRLIGYAALWGDTEPAKAALAALDPEAVRLLDDAPKTILEGWAAVIRDGGTPSAETLMDRLGCAAYCDAKCATYISEATFNPAIVPLDCVSVVNELAILDRAYTATRSIAEATRSGDTQAATEAARKMVESLSKPADDSLTVDLSAWRELAAQDPNWLILGWLLRGCATLLAAMGGVGKSLLALGLAVQTITGRTLFPSLPVSSAGRVVLLSGEDGAAVVCRRIQAYATRHGLTGIDDAIRDRLVLVSRVLPFFAESPDGGLVETEHARAVAKLVRDAKPDLLIVDHLRKVTGPLNQNSAEVMGEAVSWFHRLAADTNCAALLVCHHNKAEDRAGTQGAVRGSSATVDEARAAWNLTRGKDGAMSLVQIKTNYGQTGARVSLALSSVPSVGSVCFEETATTDPATGTGLAAMMTTAIRWLEGAERIAKGSTQNGLGAAAELLDTLKREHGARVDAKHMAEVFALLEDRGIVTVHSEDDGHGHKKPFYRLAENARTGEDYANDDCPF